ncbi:MAG TPA: polysaccharide deacetylase family protein [Flavisolibacter sp.]|nr:polysaccharide deacetylase family protein [Flavisolibacter sp.]
MKFITTSWDDGHPLDLKLADLLAKYNLPATFYIPKVNAERPVMPEQQLKELAKNFEIGGHTLNHVRLATTSSTVLETEIDGCYQWLSELLGAAPSSFCFPGGVYNTVALQTVFNAGFKMARTTELFSTKPFLSSQTTATTLQAYPHSAFTYTKHLVKRKRWTTLFNWLKSGTELSLCKLAEIYLEQVKLSGGCFHLWGHSWEIEEYNLWRLLENLFKVISDCPDFTYVQNRGLAQEIRTPFAQMAPSIRIS